MLSISKVIAILRIVAFLRKRKKKSGRFLRLVRFYRKEFDYLVEMLGNRLEPASNNKSMKTPEKLFLTLIYLSSGQSIASLSRSLKWSPSTCRTVIKDTCEALWTVLRSEYMPLATESMHRKVADRFWQLYQLPNTIGTLMGKNIAIVKPRDSGGLYYNHKGFCSFVLLAACDADFRFTMIDVGAYGSQSAESVLRNAHFGRRLFAGNLSIPAASTLPVTRGDAEEAPLINYAYIGDATLPLARNIIRPFATPTEAHEEHFNYRLQRALRKTERAFGLLTNSWRVLRKPITFEPETAVRITLACVMLHNFLRYLSSRTPVDNTVEEHVLQGLEPREEYEGEGETSPSQVQNRLLLSRYLYRNRKVHLNRED